MEAEPLVDERRTDRGLPTLPSGEPSFSEAQRIWLLERDLDGVDDRFDEMRVEFRDMREEQTHQHEKLRDEVGKKIDAVNLKLWWLVGIGFTLLLTVIGVLIAALSGSQ